jgi:hypothetical protein
MICLAPPEVDIKEVLLEWYLYRRYDVIPSYGLTELYERVEWALAAAVNQEEYIIY